MSSPAVVPAAPSSTAAQQPSQRRGRSLAAVSHDASLARKPPRAHSIEVSHVRRSAGGGSSGRAVRGRITPRVRDSPWVKPALCATVVRDIRTGRLQMLTQGNLPFLLANCSEYWDGTTIWPLTPHRRAALLAMYQQWRSEDLYCTGVAYDPVSYQETALFKLMDESLTPAPSPAATAAAPAAERGVAASLVASGSIAPLVAPPALAGHAAKPAEAAVTAEPGPAERSRATVGLEAAAPVQPPRPRICPLSLGLGFDASHVWLLAREGDMRLNAQMDARSRSKRLQADPQLASYLQPLLPTGKVVSPSDGRNAAAPALPAGVQATTPGPLNAPVALATAAAPGSLASLVEARLMRMQSGQIFGGLVAARYQPQAKMQSLIKRLDKAGIRFVYMASRSYRRTRPLAQKMGLETGWNSAISLMPRIIRPLPAALGNHADAGARGGAAGQAAAAAAVARRGGRAGSAPASSHLGAFEVEEEEDFGVEGVLSDEKRWRLMRSAVDEQTWDMKAQLPHGLPEIATHLQVVDNVPLQVSLFTDSTPPASAGMVRLMQRHGESVLLVGSALKRSSHLLFSVADVAVAVHPAEPPPPARLFVLLRDPTPPAGWALVTAPQAAGGSGLGAPAWLQRPPEPTSQRAPRSGRPLALPLPLLHPALRFASELASLHAALTLPAGESLHLLLKTVADGRRALAATRQCLAYALTAHSALALLVLVDIAAGMPSLLPLQHALWLVWVIIPTLALPLLTAPSEVVLPRGPPLNRMPQKRPLASAAGGSEGGGGGEAGGGGDAGLWDILQPPSVHPDSLLSLKGGAPEAPPAPQSAGDDGGSGAPTRSESTPPRSAAPKRGGGTGVVTFEDDGDGDGSAGVGAAAAAAATAAAPTETRSGPADNNDVAVTVAMEETAVLGGQPQRPSGYVSTQEGVHDAGVEDGDGRVDYAGGGGDRGGAREDEAALLSTAAPLMGVNDELEAEGVPGDDVVDLEQEPVVFAGAEGDEEVPIDLPPHMEAAIVGGGPSEHHSVIDSTLGDEAGPASEEPAESGGRHETDHSPRRDRASRDGRHDDAQDAAGLEESPARLLAAAPPGSSTADAHAYAADAGAASPYAHTSSAALTLPLGAAPMERDAGPQSPSSLGAPPAASDAGDGQGGAEAAVGGEGGSGAPGAGEHAARSTAARARPSSRKLTGGEPSADGSAGERGASRLAGGTRSHSAGVGQRPATHHRHGGIRARDASQPPRPRRPQQLPGGMRRGATAFDPVTGGIHAESLIRYTAYDDVTSAVAGHTVDLSDAAASLTVAMMTATAAEAPARRGGSAATAVPTTAAGAAGASRAQLWSDGAARAAGFTQGIVPAQGLLVAAAPRAALPRQARTVTLCVLAVALPGALFHEYLYQRVLAAGLQADGLLPAAAPLTWGAYPLFLPPLPLEALAPRVAWAQATVLAALVLWLASLTLHFAYRSLPPWRQSPLRLRALPPAAALAVALQLAHSHALTAAAGAPSLFVGQPPDVWAALVAWLLASAAAVHVLKRADARRFEREQLSLRLHHDVKLGMWSPR